MKIRKLLLMIVLTTIAMTTFTSCEDPAKEDLATTGSGIVGTWITPSCGFADAATWYFGSDGRGSIATKDCNGICNPIVLNFSYTVSGNTLNFAYDATQPMVHCEGYGDSSPGSPGTTSQSFDLNGNTLTVSAGGTTSVFTRSGTGGGTTGGGTSGGGTTATTGNVSFWTKTDLGCGTITVNVNGQSGSITGYNTGGVSACNVSGGANFTLPVGNYNYTASCSGGATWSGTISITAGGCLLQQLTSSNNGGGTTATNGNVSFWTKSDLGCGTITVNVNGQSGSITGYNTNGFTTCPVSGGANFTLPAGNYNYTASCSGGVTWSGTITVTAGGCLLQQLTGSTTASGCNYSLDGTWTRQNDGGCPNSTGMKIYFSNGQGVIQSAASNTCGFYNGQVKWKNFNSSSCTIDDFNMPTTNYYSYSISFVNSSTLKIGSVTYTK